MPDSSTSTYLFADLTLQSKQLGDVWLVAGGQFQEIHAFLGTELRLQINICFSDLDFLLGWKCTKLIINLKHTNTSAEDIFYTQP